VSDKLRTQVSSLLDMVTALTKERDAFQAVTLGKPATEQTQLVHDMRQLSLELAQLTWEGNSQRGQLLGLVNENARLRAELDATRARAEEQLDVYERANRALSTELALVKLDPVLKRLSDEAEPYETVKAERDALRLQVADYEKALRSECSCSGETGYTPPFNPILCDGCEALARYTKETK
jgi:regulator of replication initiation timing